VHPVVYRDSYPDTIRTRVKRFPLLPLLDMDDVSKFYVLGGRFVCLILQNDWRLNQIAISPKPGFSLCFRRCVFVNNCMISGRFLPIFQLGFSPAA
jgi:hypothetical protein